MKKWLWLALIPSLLFAETRPCTLMLQDAVYVDVHSNKVIICSEDKEIAASELTAPGNDFEQFLKNMELTRDFRYPVLILRPGSERLQRRLRKIIGEYDVDLGIEPWETGRAISREEINRNSDEAIFGGHAGIPDETVDKPKKPPYEVEIQNDHIILLKDNIIVMGDEINNPGNAFETLVDRLEADGGDTLISFQLDDSDGIKYFETLLQIISQRAPKLTDCILKDMKASILRPTPLEAQTEGKSPVYFECRNNQLFFISLNQLKIACDDKTEEIREHVDEDEEQFRKRVAETTIEVDGYLLDYTYSLLGNYVLTPLLDAKGYSFEYPSDETDEMWFGSKLANLDPEKQYICFYVRSDSFKMFRKARQLTWYKYLESTCKLLDKKDPIRIAPSGKHLICY